MKRTFFAMLIVGFGSAAFADEYEDAVVRGRLAWCHAHGAMSKAEKAACQADLDAWLRVDPGAYCAGINLQGDNLDQCVEANSDG